MPSSLLQQRVDNAWPDIEKAVTKGLKFKTGTKLRDLLPISGDTTDHGTWGAFTPVAPGRRRVATPASLPIVAHEHRFGIAYDDLDDAPLDEIQTWAEAARAFEVSDVLRVVIAEATKPTDLPPTSPPAEGIVPTGWGRPRAVYWNLPSATVDSLRAQAELVETTVHPDNPGKATALVFRMGGGLSLLAAPDMTPGWLPSTDGIELVLTAGYKLVNASPSAVNALVAPSDRTVIGVMIGVD
jgi:hypothetical protein